jgi:hypothetical protein
MSAQFKTVSLLDRFFARLWDGMIYCAIYFILTIVGTIVAINSQIGTLVGMILALAFYLLRDGFNEGGGFGKNKRGISVINIDTLEVCDYPRSFVRNSISDISTFLIAAQLGWGTGMLQLAGLMVVAVDVWRILKSDGGRRVGDVIAHTQVVYWDDYLQVKRDAQIREKEMLTVAAGSDEADPTGTGQTL